MRWPASSFCSDANQEPPKSAQPPAPGTSFAAHFLSFPQKPVLQSSFLSHAPPESTLSTQVFTQRSVSRQGAESLQISPLALRATQVETPPCAWQYVPVAQV